MILFAMLVVRPLQADDVGVEARLDVNPVALGSVTRLMISITGVDALDPIDLPEIDGFESRFVGPKTQILIVNGQYSRTLSFVYNLYPLKVGDFVIPSLAIPIDGKEYQTQSIPVKVIDAPSGASGNLSAQSSLAGATKLQDKIFVVMNTAKHEAWVGEKIPVIIKLFVDSLTVQNIEFPQFEHDGFSVDDYQEPRRYQQSVGGARYEVVEFRTFVYPARAGSLNLGPAKIVCEVLFRSNVDSFDSLGGGMFEDSFFKNFLSTYEAHPMRLESASVPIQIFSLPEGQPKSFSGGVGHFDFQVTVSPSEVKVGDPITLRMRVSGEGDWKNLSMPSLKDTEQFKTYEPQIHQDEQGKVLEQVVIPKTIQMKEIPAIEVSYFDTTSKMYQTITRGPFPLIVKEADEAAPAVVGIPMVAQPSSIGVPAVSSERFGQDISFIKDSLGDLQPVGYRTYKNISFWMAVWFLLAFWVAGWIWYQTTHRLKTDQKLARRL
ncbi:MAG: BatD family protein, partial [Candidatus Omnitrophica bacterium]|nr:BatD family protein [Candidatus Omnitrophota bacterium]